ncbi:hypothetical protein E2K64_21445, partial [Escherichia coli]
MSRLRVFRQTGWFIAGLMTGLPDLNIKPGQKVVFDVDVEHGPLPITMLMHGNVIPALAAAKVN